MNSPKTIRRFLTLALALFCNFSAAGLAWGDELKQDESSLNIKLRIKDSQSDKSPNKRGALKIAVSAKGLSKSQIAEIQGALEKMVKSITDESDGGLVLKSFEKDQAKGLGEPAVINVEQIVVHVRMGGILVKKDNKTVIASDDEMRAYLTEEKERLEIRGLRPVLLIRTERDVQFRSVQRVIKAGAAVGLKAIAYSVDDPSKIVGKVYKKEEAPETILPSIVPAEKPSLLAPMVILIGKGGNISTKDEAGTIELLEADPVARNFPILSAKLELYRSIAELTSAKPIVQLRVDPDARQQRVIDVLNALAGAKITDVTFVSLLDPESR